MEAEALAKWMREEALKKEELRLLTPQDLIDHHEKLVKIYYHAGRFAAGARDHLAVSAMVLFEEVEYADN